LGPAHDLAAAEPSEVRGTSLELLAELGLVMWPEGGACRTGIYSCLGGFHEVEWSVVE